MKRDTSAMPVHPQVQGFLDLLRATNLPPYEQSTLQQARERMDMLAMLESPAEPVAVVRNERILGPGGELPIRIYAPQESSHSPALLYFHGGGWVIGSLESHDRLCRALCNAAHCVVISVDYRLAPEHKFPAAADDCEAAFHYVYKHAADLGIDPARIAVGGDSAGGNLAAVVTLRTRASGGATPAAQVLLYPATDHRHDTPSRRDFSDGYLLTDAAMRWFSGHYLRSAADGHHPDASPAAAASLTGLPPAFILTAEYDPLRDEGEAYAERLQQAGVPVILRRCEGMIHGFLQLTQMVPAARPAIDEVAEWLRTTLSQTTTSHHV